MSLFLAVSAANAQSYYLLSSVNAGTNPGNLNNDPEQPSGALTPLGWVEIMTSTATDQWSAAQTIPFTFNFNGSAETDYIVSNTGVLTFGTSAAVTPTSMNGILPSVAIPSKSVCAWGIDLSGANDAILTQTFGTAPNRQHWISWASASTPGATGTQWTYWSIILEEGTNSIYVVDQRTAGGPPALTIGIQVDGTTAVSESSSPSVGINSNDLPDASDNTFYEFAYGTQATYDLDLSSFDVPAMAGIGSALNTSGVVRNKGSQTVTSFDLSYSVNGGAPVTANLTGVSIGSGAYENAAPTTQYTPTASGAFTMKVWVSNINGNADENPLNDTLSFTSAAAVSSPRQTLAEEFSSSTCPPCATWNTNVYNTALANYNKPGGDKLVVKYQVPIPVAGDPSRNADSDARRAYYGVNSAPTMLMNGGEIDYGSIATWADAVNVYTQTESDGLATPAFVSLTADAVLTTTATTADIDVTVNVTPNLDMTNGDFKVQIVVLQRDYVFNGATNGDVNYHHVARKMLPDANGTTLNVASGATQSVNETYSFSLGSVAEGNFNLWDQYIELVAIVENTATQTVMNAQLGKVQLIGLEEELNTIQVNAYPNPVNDVLYIENNASDNEEVKIELVNSIGQKVFENTFAAGQLIKIDTDSFDAGVYILNLTHDGKLGSRRISVVK